MMFVAAMLPVVFLLMWGVNVCIFGLTQSETRRETAILQVFAAVLLIGALLVLKVLWNA